MQLRTERGYALDEISSAVQKYIRRGWEEQAMWFAHEMETRFHCYLWRRLAVIACEDIGVANPLAIQVVNACRDAYYFHRNTNTRGASDPNFVSMAIMYLCRSLTQEPRRQRPAGAGTTRARRGRETGQRRVRGP